MIQADILNCQDIGYHIDSYTLQAIIQSNVGLLKRLNTAPTGFMNSSQKFGMGNTSGSAPLPSKRQGYSQQGGNRNNSKSSGGWGGKKSGFSSGGFSQSSFYNSNKKFWNKKDT